MTELVEYIAKSLVDHPERVAVTSAECGDELCITLKVDKSDMGKVIGRGGKIAKAIRSVVKAVSLKDNTKVRLDIEEL
ncbi:KH domain-containing protein [Peptoniphilus equinus]|uniref:RNA-binding protein KhpA n=1 Tax=Peptoniphilus equinus TaxID=3016343 RepID=A0ABY7QV21_9FIRM|nr:KH domain-containing protein [Peptoniphilus equinus]WBW50627.1 KH domain-containing protein [Peptoniphilus equinus]